MTKKQKKILVATGEIVAEKAPIVAVNEKYLLTIKEAQYRREEAPSSGGGSPR